MLSLEERLTASAGAFAKAAGEAGAERIATLYRHDPELAGDALLRMFIDVAKQLPFRQLSHADLDQLGVTTTGELREMVQAIERFVHALRHSGETFCGLTWDWRDGDDDAPEYTTVGDGVTCYPCLQAERKTHTP
jgi:hypothetical protein